MLMLYGFDIFSTKKRSKILILFRLKKNSIENPCVIILYILLYIEKSDYKKESSWLILMKTI